MTPANAPATPPAEQALPLGLKMCWGLGSFGAALLSNTVGALVLYYLAKIVGMSPWLAGLLLTAARLYDAFLDPFIGHMSDRTPPRWGGRRRPWLFAGAFLSAIALLAVFSTPFRGDSPETILYVLAALMFYGTAYSVFNVPYITMPAEMTEGYHERSSIHAWRVVFSGIGIAGAGAGGGLLLGWLSHGRATGGVQANTAADYATLAAIYSVLILVSMLVTWRGTRSAVATVRTEHAPPWRDQVGSFLANRPFMTVIAAKCFQLIAVSANQAALFFVVVEILKRSSAEMALISLPSTATSILVTPLLVKLSRRIGKRAAYMLTSLFTCSAYVSWSFAQVGEPSWLLVARGMTLGVGFAGGVLFAMSMITDAIEWDTYRTGMRREGMYTAFFSFCEKFTGALGPTLVGIALSVAGFNAKTRITPDNYDQIRHAALLGASYVPAICAVTAALLLTRYRLDSAELARMRTAYQAHGVRPAPAE